MTALTRTLATAAVGGLLALGVAAPVHADTVDKDCKDYATQADAQEEFDQMGGVGSDVYNLDSDDDGIACESYFGDRSTATTINSGIPAPSQGTGTLVGGGLLLLAGAGVAVRARKA